MGEETTIYNDMPNNEHNNINQHNINGNTDEVCDDEPLTTTNPTTATSNLVNHNSDSASCDTQETDNRDHHTTNIIKTECIIQFDSEYDTSSVESHQVDDNNCYHSDSDLNSNDSIDCATGAEVKAESDAETGDEAEDTARVEDTTEDTHGDTSEETVDNTAEVEDTAVADETEAETNTDTVKASRSDNDGSDDAEVQNVIRSMTPDNQNQETTSEVTTTDGTEDSLTQTNFNEPTVCPNLSNTLVEQLTPTNKLHNIVYVPSSGDVNHDTDHNDDSNGSNNNSNYRIVATIGSSHQELKYLKATLESLESECFDQVYFNCPAYFFNYSADMIPEWLKNSCHVNLLPDRDRVLGNYSKIIPVLAKETNPDTIIVALESGVIYPKGMVKNIKAAFRRFPDSAHAPRLFKFKGTAYYQNVTINGNVGDIYDPVYGVAYRRSFFKRDFTSYVSLLLKRGCGSVCDDLLISNYLARYKITLRCILRKFYHSSGVKLLVDKSKFYHNYRLDLKTINLHYQVVCLLQQMRLLSLRNPHVIGEAVRHLNSGQYLEARNNVC